MDKILAGLVATGLDLAATHSIGGRLPQARLPQSAREALIQSGVRSR